MLSVPSFLLRKLYVKGSLQNTPQGVSFRLRNSLGSGYAEAMAPLTLDGLEMPLEDTYFFVDSEPRSFDTVSRENPFSLLLNQDTVITIENTSLSPEPHKVGMGFKVPGLGMLRFDFVDQPPVGDQPAGEQPESD
jgi:hydroxymethylglutaryl-CoA reductase (NADPH)